MASYIVFNNASAIQYANLVKGDFSMNIVILTDPTAGHSRKFGLFSESIGSGLYFEVDGTSFKAVAIDGVTGDTDEVALTYDSAWSRREVVYRIVWEAGLAHFYIQGTRVATIAFSDEGLDLTSTPLSPYFLNASSDDMYVGYLDSKGIQSYSYTAPSS